MVLFPHAELLITNINRYATVHLNVSLSQSAAVQEFEITKHTARLRKASTMPQLYVNYSRVERLQRLVNEQFQGSVN